MVVPGITVLIKPASSMCNMKCRYCFYHSLSDIREMSSYGMISEETANNIISKAFEFCSNFVVFSFQGGEPSLAGLIFFRFFVGQVKKLNTKKLQISFSFQTNGFAMDEEWAKFFCENNILVGLSLDGSKEINDMNRLDSKGIGTFGSIMRTSELFNKNKVEYNILCVVTANSARHIEQIYNFFKKAEFRYLQFIPCIGPLDEEAFSSVYQAKTKVYASFLKRLFKLWFDDYMSGYYVSIRFFDNLITAAAGYPPEQCGMSGYCNGQFVIEGDGSTFPCDFYCVDNWKTGNINKNTFEEIANAPTMIKFRQTSILKDAKCDACSYYPLCRGGCRRDRDYSTNGAAGDNVYCESLKEFYEYATPYIKQVLIKLQEENMKQNMKQ